MTRPVETANEVRRVVDAYDAVTLWSPEARPEARGSFERSCVDATVNYPHRLVVLGAEIDPTPHSVLRDLLKMETNDPHELTSAFERRNLVGRQGHAAKSMSCTVSAPPSPSCMRGQTSSSERGVNGIPWASATGADTRAPSTVLTPAARAGSAATALRQPWFAKAST